MKTLNQIFNRNLKTSARGFTLIEILLVLTLLGIVFSIVGGKVFSSFGKGKVKAAQLQIKQVEGALDRYRLDCGSYPTTDQGLKSLVEAPTGGKICKDYDPEGYMGGSKKTPTDPWGNEFKYTCDNGLNYVITSMGEDGVEGGEGKSKDLSSADE